MTNEEIALLWAEHEQLYAGGRIFTEEGPHGEARFRFYARIGQSIMDVIKDKVVLLPDGKVLLVDEGELNEREIYNEE